MQAGRADKTKKKPHAEKEHAASLVVALSNRQVEATYLQKRSEGALGGGGPRPGRGSKGGETIHRPKGTLKSQEAHRPMGR